METKTENVQVQINEINQKLDLLLNYVNDQRLKSEAIEDLVADVSIISNDAFTSIVHELDKQGIELNVDDIKNLVYKLLRNVDNFSQVMDLFESVTDFLKDAGPMVTEMGIDFTYKLHTLEQKGYFEWFKEMGTVADHAVVALQKTSIDPDKKYSIFRIMRELNSPEVKRALGFMLEFLKNFSRETANDNK